VNFGLEPSRMLKNASWMGNGKWENTCAFRCPISDVPFRPAFSAAC
jgi:hypothetical protein